MTRKAPKAVREYLQALGRRGGRARLSTMTPEERSASARKASRARWGTRKGGSR